MAVSASGFKTRFTRYASVADATIDIYLGLAERRLNTSLLVDSDRQDDAHYYLAAHLYALEQMGVEGSSGPITSKRVGDIAVSYASGSSMSRSSLQSTVYGRHFYDLMKTTAPTPRVL